MPQSTYETVNYLTNNVSAYLSMLPGVHGLSLTSLPPLPMTSVVQWESSNQVMLPQDLKDFYSCGCNGLRLQWSTDIMMGANAAPVLDPSKVVNNRQHIMDIAAGRPLRSSPTPVAPGSQQTFPAASATVLPLASLKPATLPESCVFAAYYTRLTHSSTYIPPRTTIPTSKSTYPLPKAFALDSNPPYGAILLVYNAPMPDSPPCTTPTIWYLDRSARAHYLTNSFTSYLRLSMLHLGINGWWALFGDDGLDPTVEAVLRRYAPERLAVAETNMSVRE